MLPLVLLSLLIRDVSPLPLPPPASESAPGPSPESYKCELTPDSPRKVYKWTPETPGNLWELAGRFQGDLVARSPRVLSRGERCVLTEGVDYWPEAVVPIDIKRKGFGWMDVQIIDKALNIIEDKTCIRFPPRRDNDTSYVELRGDLGYGECWSYLGRIGGNQTLSLGDGCVNLHHALHEICHALGMVHQHSAPDRDDYIDIHWENIDPEFTEWFDKYSADEYTDFGLGYDYYSVMHYSDHIASKNGKPTITAKDPNVKIEDRTTLSEKDVKKLNILYCSDNNYVGRKNNYRTFGGFVVDLMDDFSFLSRNVLALGLALWLLIATTLLGRCLFSWVLGVGKDPDPTREEQPSPETEKKATQRQPIQFVSE